MKKDDGRMADRFLHEVERMHQLRRDINEMTPEEADELIRGLGDHAAEDWVFAARDAQLPPPDCRGAGCFSAAAAPANRTRCRQRCILRFALASSAFTSSPQPRPTFTTSTSKARAVYSRPAAVIRDHVGRRRGGGWNGLTARCACSSRARSRNRCGGRKR